MGHAGAIALGIALHRPSQRVFLLDGDGAALMHMGAMATIGAAAPPNLVHVLLNNEAHESVGGAPTAAHTMDFPAVARAVGYRLVQTAADAAELAQVLPAVERSDALTFRPTTTPTENKEALMRTLEG